MVEVKDQGHNLFKIMVGKFSIIFERKSKDFNCDVLIAVLVVFL